MPYAAHYYTGVLMGLCLASMIAILIHYIYKLMHEKTKIVLFFSVTTFISMVSFIIATGIDFFDLLYYFATGIDVIYTDEIYLIGLANIFYGMATVAMYTMVFGRLYITFKLSAQKYQMSKTTIWVLVSLIAINAVLLLFYSILIFVMGGSYDDATRALFYDLLQVSHILLQLLDAFLTIAMLITFVRKLQHIVLESKCKYQEYSIYSSRMARIGPEETEDKNATDLENVKPEILLSQRQVKLITVVTRHTVLSSIAIIFNQFFYISVIIGGEFTDIDAQNTYFLAYSNLLKAILGLVNAATLHLNFGFNIRLYRRFCNKLHMFCYRWFEVKAKHEIDDNILQSMSSDQTTENVI